MSKEIVTIERKIPMQYDLCNCRQMSISDPICLLEPVALCGKQDTEKKSSNLLRELAAFSC